MRRELVSHLEKRIRKYYFAGTRVKSKEGTKRTRFYTTHAHKPGQKKNHSASVERPRQLRILTFIKTPFATVHGKGGVPTLDSQVA